VPRTGEGTAIGGYPSTVIAADLETFRIHASDVVGFAWWRRFRAGVSDLFSVAASASTSHISVVGQRERLSIVTRRHGSHRRACEATYNEQLNVPSHHRDLWDRVGLCPAAASPR